MVIGRWLSDSEAGYDYISRPFRYQITILGKLFTHIYAGAAVDKEYNLVLVILSMGHGDAIQLGR